MTFHVACGYFPFSKRNLCLHFCHGCSHLCLIHFKSTHEHIHKTVDERHELWRSVIFNLLLYDLCRNLSDLCLFVCWQGKLITLTFRFETNNTQECFYLRHTLFPSTKESSDCGNILALISLLILENLKHPPSVVDEKSASNLSSYNQLQVLLTFSQMHIRYNERQKKGLFPTKKKMFLRFSNQKFMKTIFDFRHF